MVCMGCVEGAFAWLGSGQRISSCARAGVRRRSTDAWLVLVVWGLTMVC